MSFLRGRKKTKEINRENDLPAFAWQIGIREEMHDELKADKALEKL